MTWANEATEAVGGWDWGLFWTVVAAVVGVLALTGVVFTIIGYYRDHPKRRLEYTVRSRRLVQATPRAPLEVKVSGIDVPDPHLVEFRLVSNSRADIPTSAFDAGLPLRIQVSKGGAFVLGAERTNGGIQTSGGHGEGWDWAEFEVGPQLIRKGSSLELDWISNGTPVVNIDSPLVDVNVWNVTRRPKRADIVRLLFLMAANLVATSLMVGALLNAFQQGPVAVILVGIVLLLTLVGVVLWIRFIWNELAWRRRAQQ